MHDLVIFEAYPYTYQQNSVDDEEQVYLLKRIPCLKLILVLIDFLIFLHVYLKKIFGIIVTANNKDHSR